MAPMHKSLVVLTLLVGCGDDGVHHLPDAPEGIDAATPDAPLTGAVTLTVTQDGTPRADVAVYFLAADSTLVAKVPTNAQGVATATMGLGGSVTAIDPFSTKSAGRDVRTFVGVKPGDQLKLYVGGTAAQSVNFTLTLPTDAFAFYYTVSTDCGSTQFFTGGGSGSGGGPVGGPVTLDGCGATTDILIETYDGNSMALGAIYKPNVAITEGGTVDLTAEAYTTPVPTATINWSNVPTEYTQINGRYALASPKGFLRETYLTADVTEGAGTFTIPSPGVTGGIAITGSQPLPSNFIGQQTVVDWAPEGTAPIAVDLANTLLGTYSTTPSVSGATHTVTWAASPGVAPDFAHASLFANRPNGKSSTFWSWDIVVPYATTTFTLPTLPTEIADLNFQATDSVAINELITAKVPGGYDAVRADILSSNPAQLVAGATGRIVVETMASQPTVARVAPPLRSWTTRPAHARK
jgi:hypothetical protein